MSCWINLKFISLHSPLEQICWNLLGTWKTSTKERSTEEAPDPVMSCPNQCGRPTPERRKGKWI